tara:strand:- start:1033 stop:2028 length:996 start_codon:yes stop_codon:yes gene_type:complete
MSHETTARAEAAATYDYGDPPAADYWAAQAETFTLPGLGLSDMSPHDSALHTFYMASEIEEASKNKPYVTPYTHSEVSQIIDNAEAYFLDKVYDADGIVREGIDVTVGYDLKRTGLDDNMNIRSPEYWDQLGGWATDEEGNQENPVDWAHYENDIAYQAAFKALAEAHPEIYRDWDKSPDDTDNFDFDFDRFGSDEFKKESVDLIRHANKGMIGDLVKDWRNLGTRFWEGKYDSDKIYMAGDDLYIDGERQISPTERYGRQKGAINPDTGKAWTAQERGRIADAEDMYTWEADKIVGPQTQVVKPAGLNINNIKPVTVQRPANIPASWGAV